MAIETVKAELPMSDEEVVTGAPVRRRPGWLSWLPPLASGIAQVWIGMAFVAAGFALIGVTWAGVAGRIVVGRQLPYLVSGGLTAVCLVLVGVMLARAGADRNESAQQLRGLDRLEVKIEELRVLLEASLSETPRRER